MIAVPSLLSGCLVTDTIEFDQPVNSPPMFVERPGSDLDVGDTKWVYAREAPSWTFRFRVRDADVDQILEAHWRIVTGEDEDPDREETIVIPPTASGSLTRDFEIDINQLQLIVDNCHRIQVAVSGSFKQPEPGDPEEFDEFDELTDDADIARFNFSIWEGAFDSNDPDKIVGSCQAETVSPPVVTVGTAGESGR